MNNPTINILQNIISSCERKPKFKKFKSLLEQISHDLYIKEIGKRRRNLFLKKGLTNSEIDIMYKFMAEAWCGKTPTNEEEFIKIMNKID